MNGPLSSLDSQAPGVWDGLKDSIMSPPISRENSRSFSLSPGWNLNSSFTNSTIQPSTKPWNMHRNLSTDFNPAPGARPSHYDASSDDYWARYHQLKSLDNYKNSLIEDLLGRIDCLTEQYRKECDDNEAAREYVARREPKYKENILRLQMLMDRDPFVLILLDGNGTMFQDDFIAKGEAGGREAAHALQEAILNCILTQHPEFPPDTRIVVRFYADCRRLGEHFSKKHVIDRASDFYNFARGFTSEQNLFDFIDVSGSAELCTEKVSDVFKLHLHDYHCRQLYFGCSQDSHYASLLNQCLGDPSASKRVTLLHGAPLNDDILGMPFAKRTLENIFCNDGIILEGGRVSVQNSEPSGPFSSSARLRSDSRNSDEALPKNNQDRKESGSCSTGSVGDKPSPIHTWASAVQQKSAVEASPTPTSAKSVVNIASSASGLPAFPSTSDTIPRNRKGQRIDPIVKHDKDEVDRVKKLKLCNVHFLRKQCPYGDSCSHDHAYRPTANEIRTLSLVARMAPCIRGTECEDPKCLYGHHCMAPEGRDHNKLCIFGDNCKFPKELHHIDRNPVRTLRV